MASNPVVTLRDDNSNPFSTSSPLPAHPGAAVLTSLNQAAATGAGTVLNTGLPHQTVTMAVTLAFTVAPTAISTQLQGSLDGVNWFSIGAPITSAGAGTTAVSASGTPAQYYRANLGTLTGGTAVQVTALIGVAA